MSLTATVHDNGTRISQPAAVQDTGERTPQPARLSVVYLLTILDVNICLKFMYLKI
jgi:hypothetical protein